MGLQTENGHLVNDSDSEEGEEYSSEEGEEESESEEEDESEEEESIDGDDDDDDDDGEESAAMVSYDENQNRDIEENPEEFDDEEQSQYKDEEEEDEEPNRMGAKICAAILCCCCCLLIIIGIILGLTLFRQDKDSESSTVKGQGGANAPTVEPAPGEPTPSFDPIQRPTLAPFPLPPSARPPPTNFPTVSPEPSASPVVVPTPKPTLFPTLMPTLSPAPTQTVPDVIGLPPFADITIFTDGISDLQFENFGTEDSLLVQDGLASKTQIPDAYSLLAFDMTNVPSSRDRLWDRDTSAILRLQHVPAAIERGPATLHIVRLPSTRLDIETLHGGLFFPDGGIEGPSFEVAPADTEVNVDITNLVFNYTVELDQLFLMIENRGPEQEAGDRFKSRESGEPPQIIFNFTPNGNTRPPAASPAPSARSSQAPVSVMPSTMGTPAAETSNPTVNQTAEEAVDDAEGGR